MTEWISVDKQLPYSGQSVLCFIVGEYGKNDLALAVFIQPKTLEINKFNSDAEYDKDKDRYFFKGGFYEKTFFDDGAHRIKGNVTHWMPEPDYPPEEETE